MLQCYIVIGRGKVEGRVSYGFFYLLLEMLSKNRLIEILNWKKLKSGFKLKQNAIPLQVVMLTAPAAKNIFGIYVAQ